MLTHKGKPRELPASAVSDQVSCGRAFPQSRVPRPPEAQAAREASSLRVSQRKGTGTRRSLTSTTTDSHSLNT